MAELDPFLNAKDSLANSGTNVLGYQFDAQTERSAVGNMQIHDLAVTTAKIGSAAITTAKITDAAITTAKITDANITTAKINDAAITTAKINDAAITTAKIGAAQITTALINDAAITNAKIENLAVTTGKINDFSFNQGSGGTLTLGGTLNGNGLLSIVNGTGGTVIRGDNTGHHYYNTSGTELVTINSSGLTIQDTSAVKLVTSDNTGFETWRNSAGTAVSVAKMNDSGLIARNTRGMFFEETTAGNYSSIAIGADNIWVIKANQSGSEVIAFQDYNGNSYGKWRKNATPHALLDLDSYLSILTRTTAEEPADGAVADGSLWYNSSTKKLRIMTNGTKATIGP